MPRLVGYKLTDLFSNDELNRAMKLFIECKNTKENFRQRCTKEVVEPVISRFDEYAGCNATPASLVYRLEMYLRAVRGEQRLQQRPLEATMEELFTKGELDRARKIFNKYKAKPRYFREQKLGNEVVKPKIDQINAYTGYNNLPEYWAYCLVLLCHKSPTCAIEKIPDSFRARRPWICAPLGAWRRVFMRTSSI
jgi:hypothetical protein